MTAEQQLAQAFDREWQHAVGTLPARPCLSDHAVVLQHHRCELSIQELVRYYSRKLPAYLYGPRLLSAGQQLMERQEYSLAADACFRQLAALNLPNSPDSCQRLDAAGRLALHTQALYGVQACQAAEAFIQDSQLQHPHTLTAALTALAGLQEACSRVLPAQPELVYQSTQHIHSIAAKLLAARLHAEALPFLLFAARAMECHISLCSTNYLPWRVQLYTAAAECYYAQLISTNSSQGSSQGSSSPVPADAGSPAAVEQHSTSAPDSTGPGQATTPSSDAGSAAVAEAARDLLASGLSGLAGIARAQALDAVPAPDVTAGIQAAHAQLLLLQSLFEQHTAAAAAGNEQPSAAAQLQEAARAIGSKQLQLAALLRLLTAGLAVHESPLQRVALPPSLQPAMTAAGSIGSKQLQLAALLRLLTAGLAVHESPLQRVALPPSLQPAMTAAAELAASVFGLDAAITEGTTRGCTDSTSSIEELHRELMRVAYSYQQQELLQKLLAAAPPSGSGSVEQESAGPSLCRPVSCSLAATAAVLDAVVHLQSSPGEATMQHLARVLADYSSALSACMPRLVAAAAVELHAAARTLLQGCFVVTDGSSELVQGLLQGLHVALQQSGHPDGILRGGVALRLAALLEQQHQLDGALAVVKEGLGAVVAARSAALVHLQGHLDEHLRWISGSRTQPDGSTAELLKGMSDDEQVLACMHADAVMVETRLELKLGLQDAAAKAAARQQRLQASLTKRDQQADIFGARTRKERRLDAVAVEHAGYTPSTAPEVEQRLLLECGRCLYQRALVLTATAAMQPDPSRQAALLEEACDALQSAHTSEAEIFKSQQPGKEALRPLSAHHVRPINPKVLCRTPNSITLTTFPLKLSGAARQPARFAAYCKPCAAGVSLTVNKTAMEYPGSGVQVAMGDRVTVDGLQSNEAYNFAVAVYDDQGNMMGELGSSSPALVMSLPLPLYYCHALVLLAAARLGLWTVAKRAAGALFPWFFVTTPARPVWQAHPMDRFSIQAQQIAAQVPQFLRLLVQAVFAYAGHQGAKHMQALAAGQDSSKLGSPEAADSSSGLVATAASRALMLSLSESHLLQQVALLEAAQRHLLAMQVAATADDEMLIEEGALRAYNLLVPLLQQRDISPMLLRPLSDLHTLLVAVKDAAPSSITGHKQQRQQAAQATAAACFWKLRLLAPVRPDLVVGSAAVSTYGILGLHQTSSSAAVTALDAALVRALGGSSSPAAAPVASDSTSTTKQTKAGSKKQPAGQKAGHKAASEAASTASAAPAAHEQAQELVALQELLLWHPSGRLWAAELCASRSQDTTDLVAQVLPRLQQPHALTACWPVLSAPTAQSHPEWLQLCVLVMQAAAQQHGAALWLSLPPAAAGAAAVGIAADSLPEAARTAAAAQLAAAATAASELLQAVQQYVRMAARRPQLVCWASQPRWSVDAGAAALEAEGFQLGDQGTAAAPTQPELPAGTAAGAKTAALAAWQQQTMELLVQERRCLAAAVLLQQRLPVLLGRRQAIMAARQQLATWAPWLAHFHSIVGGMAGEAAAQLLAQSAPEASQSPAGPAPAQLQPVDAAGAPATGSATGPLDTEVVAAAGAAEGGAVGAGGSKPGSLQSSRPVSPRKAGAEGSSSEPAAPAAAAAAAGGSAGQKGGVLQELAQVMTLQTLQQFAQAATLAARGRNHQQLFNISRQLHTVSTYLLNRLPSLLLPVPPTIWSLRALPEPHVPVLVAAAPERPAPGDAAAASTATGKGAAGDKKGAGGAALGGKAAAATDKKPPGGASKGVRQAAGGTPRADAKHTLLPEPGRLHVGIPLRAAVAALLAALHHLREQGSNSRQLSLATATAAGDTGAVTARSHASSGSAAATASVFSFGSDAIRECWHKGAGINMESLTQLVAAVLRVLRAMQKWTCLLQLGSAWMAVCQGSADAVLVPMLLDAARQAGSATDVAALTAAKQALAGDRNIALDELAKVRSLVAELLGHLAPLDSSAAACSDTVGPGQSLSHSQWPSSAASSDELLLPAEYERVMAQLKKRNEKGHMILALKELGDVHAHFGSWSKAKESWSSAADALLGPYRVVDAWRLKLELGTHEDLLKRYGVHGLLLAVTMLGKLARYCYPADLNSRLSCALLAAELLPAVFATDIIHPQRRVDFAAYTPVQIWPGVDVFEDEYRCNAAALASSLQCLSGVLHEQQLHLMLLPLLALWEHTTLYITHDKDATVLARITRVRALVSLGLLPQAATVLECLVQGAHLPGLLLEAPQPILGSNGLACAMETAAAAAAAGAKGKEAGAGAGAGAGADASGNVGSRQHLYRADQWPSHPCNAAFLQYVQETVLDPAVCQAYGPWLCGQITITRAAFLAAAGAAANSWITGKTSNVVAAVRSGPPAAAPVAADAVAVGSNAAASGPPSAGTTQGGAAAAGAAKSGKAAGTAAATGPQGAKAAAAAAAAGTASHTAPGIIPGAAELKLLSAAAQMLQGVVTSSCAAAGMSAAALGFPWADQGSKDAKSVAGKAAARKDKDKAGSGSHGTTAKGHSPSNGSKAGAHKTGKPSKSTASSQPHDQHADSSDSAAADRRAAAAADLLVAQHQHLLVEALQELSRVEAARWLPLQALPVCLAICEAIKHAASGSSCAGEQLPGGFGDGSFLAGLAEEKAALQPGPSAWLAARLQLSQVLLQLNHHAPCVNVCIKALTDAARAGDTAWSARLLGVQAAALAAQEDHLAALNCYRTALSRLQEQHLPGVLSLQLQLDCAALCDQVGARGDFDRLTGTALAASAAEVEELGLAEMREHDQLTNIYLPTITRYLSALLGASAAATRRHQLVTAERHLRGAADLLGRCRCLPLQAAAVLTSLARVLRLQAAVQLPDTAMLGPPATQHCATGHSQQACQGSPKAAVVDQDAGLPTGSNISSSSGGMSNVGDLQQRRLQAAAHLLGVSLQVLIADGGSNPMLVRPALLELAAVWLQAAASSEILTASTQPSNASTAGALPAAGAGAVMASALRVTSVLKAASVTSGHVCKLLLESHSLQPVQAPSSCLPDWLLELLRGHEQLQTSLQADAAAAAAAIAAGGSAKPASSAAAASSLNNNSSSSSASTACKQVTAGGVEAAAVPVAVPDATLGRLAVCFYIQQLTAAGCGALGAQQQLRASQQALMVQPMLRGACPRFAADCCWPDVPNEVAAALQGAWPPAAPLPVGTVAVQWYRQDGCWQAPSSWCCHGALPPSGQLTPADLANLPRQQPCISCLYVLIMPPAPPTAAAEGTGPAAGGAGGAAGSTAAAGGDGGGGMSAQGPGLPLVLQGELVVSLERAKRVQLQVKAMRTRLESPGKPTDLYAQPPPSTAELAATKHSLECLLAGIPEDDMGPPPRDLPPPTQLQQQQLGQGTTTLATAAAAAPPAAAPGAKATPAAAAAAAAKAPAGAKGGSGPVGGAVKGAAGAGGGGTAPAGAAGGSASGTTGVGGVGGGVVCELVWGQLETWVKLEVLMDLEGGLLVTDAAVARWLGEVLGDRQQPAACGST